MKISKKAYYGVRAVLALAQSKKPLSIHALAEAEHLPQDYLEKILQILRRASLVEAKKGTSGGYSLARGSKDVNTWEILRALDGPMKPFATPVRGELPCFQPSHCQTNEVWRKLETEIETTLSRISIHSLIPKNHKFSTP
ncbi:MAG: Rrf2 family transcriptional regulator [Candidatus Moranbacteria bacterium]|nr:Rrf2 family transcriptional regulator [Candidatus Moranbacteria bacterium]